MENPGLLSRLLNTMQESKRSRVKNQTKKQKEHGHEHGRLKVLTVLHKAGRHDGNTVKMTKERAILSAVAWYFATLEPVGYCATGQKQACQGARSA